MTTFPCLSEISIGTEVVVESISGGKSLRQRLINLGVLPGAELKVVRISKHGPLVVNVQGAQVIIGRAMAGKIYVKQK
ncbi:MAG: FeoA family protein [Spirochaetales bacterium]|nr:FeoA family protein [Spirochaetales bacterium]